MNRLSESIGLLPVVESPESYVGEPMVVHF
jgi:hypothetical protein